MRSLLVALLVVMCVSSALAENVDEKQTPKQYYEGKCPLYRENKIKHWNNRQDVSKKWRKAMIDFLEKCDNKLVMLAASSQKSQQYSEGAPEVSAAKPVIAAKPVNAAGKKVQMSSEFEEIIRALTDFEAQAQKRRMRLLMRIQSIHDRRRQ